MPAETYYKKLRGIMDTMDIETKRVFIDQDKDEDPYFSVEHPLESAQAIEADPDTPRFLLILPVGIGDAVLVGSSIIDQIIKNDSHAYGKIDIIGNNFQAELFKYDPRINRILRVNPSLFPTVDRRTWLKGVILDPRATELIRFLQYRHYEAVYAGRVAPSFYARLHSHIIYPDFTKLSRDFLSLGSIRPIHISKMARKAVDKYYGTGLSERDLSDQIPLYISSKQVQKAMLIIESIKERSSVPREKSKLLVVASDTTSVITRPPTSLLAAGISGALKKDVDLIVYILPGYTDTRAAANLYFALVPSFEGRVFMMPAEPRASLLDTAELIDLGDIFVTGDTGLMHLAVATKKLREDDDARFTPCNAVKIIALFGGTNPALFGYSKHTTILGRGRKEQRAFMPNLSKELYNPKGRNLFDHIAPPQLTDAIMNQLQGESKLPLLHFSDESIGSDLAHFQS